VVLKNRKTVIIEDDPVFSEVVAALFEHRGYQTFAFFNMEDAINGIPHLKPILVIADVFLPGIGGVEGIRLLKSKWPDQKILAMSGGWGGMSAGETLKAIKTIGADGGLIKPFGSEDLDAAMEMLGLPTKLK